MHGLKDVRVIDFSTGIAGPYCTKLLADAGADVVKVEASTGDPLRRWSATGAELGAEDGALFRFLNQNKRSQVGGPEDAHVLGLVADADLAVESFEPGFIDALDLPSRFPGLALLSISGFGRGGPWSGRPWTEFTIQAESGSIGTRGLAGGEPFQCGGRTPEWLAGTYAAVAALAALRRTQRSGRSEHIDFSILEVMTLAGTNYMDLIHRLLGVPLGDNLPQSVETPSIEPTADGYVGFCTNSRQQFRDFLLMIGHTELQDDEVLAQVAGRMARFDAWNSLVHAWTEKHTTAEVIEQASLLRIPVAPINNGDSVRNHEHLAAVGAFQTDPSGGFLHPRPPYRIDAESAPPFRPAPRLGEHNGRIEARERSVRHDAEPAGLPLSGLRIIDMTAWWAGPSATQLLALLGAEVIHVESAQRPDGMRMVGGMLRGVHADWWECSHFFLAANVNKRGLALDLATARGRELMQGLIGQSDAVFDNFTPRVLENFGLTWEVIHALSPQTILVRMPAFGLSGPWRDHTGFAQTMEQMTGMAWLTGHRDDQPRIQRGPCDPLAGMHAAFAFLVALEEREAKGAGVHVECPMVEGALNAAAEQLVEFTAYGRLMQRDGNRSPAAAPQGLYPCQGSRPGSERWLALSVASDEQWHALCGVLGHPPWTQAASLGSLAGRRAAHDAIDTELGAWFGEREREACVETMLGAGVPAAPVVDPRVSSANPQMVARGFFEPLAHPVVGEHPVPTLPYRLEGVERWTRSPAPLLGQHNRELLGDILGLDAAELDRLEADGVIGTRLEGAS